MHLYLSSRLVKADDSGTDLPDPGGGAPDTKGYDPKNVDYVSKQDVPERPQNAVGETDASWVVPKGSASPATGTQKPDADTALKEAEKKELEKDPLKQDAEPEGGSDLEGAKEAQEKLSGTGEEEPSQPGQEGTPTGTEGDPGQENDPSDPFGDDPKADEAGLDAMEHYHAANIAEKLGDEKESHKHRELAKQKTGDFDGTQHDDMFSKLQAAGYHDDAEHHSNKRKEYLMSRAEAGAEERGAMRRPSLRERMQTDRKIARRQASNANTEVAGAPPQAKTQASTPVGGAGPVAPTEVMQKPEAAGAEPDVAGAAENFARQRAGEADTQQQPAVQKPDGGRGEPGMDSGGAWSKEEAEKKTGPDLESQQKEGQKRASEEFKQKSAEHKTATQAAKDEQAKYEADLKSHQDALKEHGNKLDEMKQKLQDHADGKPVRDDTETNKAKAALDKHKEKTDKHKKKSPKADTRETDKLKKQLEEHRAKMQEHAATKPDDRKVKAAAEILKRTKANAPGDAPKRAPSDTSGKAFESKLKAHKEKTAAYDKKVKVAEVQHDSLKTNHNQEMQKYKDTAKKLNAKKLELDGKHRESRDASKAAHAGASAEHKAAGKQLEAEGKQLKTAHESAKKKAAADHAKAQEDYGKKEKTLKEEQTAHQKSKKDLPPKPKQPKAKKIEATHKTPETAGEKSAHKEYTEHHQSRADNIASHLKNNQNLSDEQRAELKDLHAEHSYHANVENVPTKEQRAESKDISNRSKKHGADRHHDEVRAEQEQKAAKDEAKAAKQQERDKKAADKQAKTERETTPRPPENEMEEAEVQAHAGKAQEALDNVQSHLENNDDISDEERKTLEDMASKLEDHAKLKTVPTKDQQAEFKNALKHTKKHSGKHFDDSPEGKAGAGGAGAPSNKPAPKKTAGKKTTGSIRRLYQLGAAAGSKLGSAAASPYGGAGGLGASALNAPGKGVAAAGHYLFNERRPANDNAKKEETKAASLRLYIRNDL